MSTTNNQQARTVQPSNEVLQEGLAAAEKGYSVFFVSNKIPAVDGAFYAATQDPEEIVEMARRCGVVKGLAIATGSGFSDVVVIDADSKEAYDWMVERYGQPHVKTRRGGHWYFLHPKDGKIKTVSKYDANKLLDCKGDQGLVEAPPSKGKSWTNGIPDKSTLRVLPEELRPPKVNRPSREEGAQLSEEHYEAGVDVLAENYPPKGVRHEAGLPLAGFMGRNGVGEDDALNVVMDARERLPEPMTEKTERSIAGVIRSTYEKLRNGDEDVTGGPTLDRLVPGLPEKLAEALGLDEQAPETEEDRRRIKEKAAEEAWAVCEPLAKSDDILSEVYALQEQDGLVGEETNAKIMQLVSATRHKGKPMSIIVNGESSGGKSFLLKETIKTLPDEAVHVLQSISDKALAYIGENTLTDKFLLIYELGGLGKEGEQGLEMIKQLLTEGRIDRQIAESVQGKGVQGRRVYAEGPTGLWTTTTKNVLDRELQNRALSLTIDESPRQTELIIKGRKNRKQRGQVDFSSIKALHTWLAAQGGDVDIPYEDVIADGVEARAVRMRRFYDYIMELVEAHALMHRANRVQDADGFVLAKPEDYAAVYKLVKNYVAVAAEVGVSHSQRETVETARLIIDSDKPLTRSTLAEKLDISESSASRRLGSATSEGYLKHDPDAKGKTKVYVIGDISLPDETKPAIPAPEDIEEAARAAYDDACMCAMRARTPSPSDTDVVKSVVSRATPQCTHDAHMDPEENGSSQNSHTYGESSDSAETENADFGPSVHTLHTCTHQENGYERANVHAAVQWAVHASEGGDPPLVDTPLGKAPPWLWRMYLRRHVLRYIRRAKRIADVFENDPARYDEMPEKDREALRVWVRETVVPKPKITHAHSSYALKEYAEADLSIYVHNAWFKAAMLEAGHASAWDNRINMGFRAGPSYSWMHPKKRAQIQARKEQEARWQAELEQVEAELEELRAAHIAKYGEAPDAWTKEQL